MDKNQSRKPLVTLPDDPSSNAAPSNNTAAPGTYHRRRSVSSNGSTAKNKKRKGSREGTYVKVSMEDEQSAVSSQSNPQSPRTPAETSVSYQVEEGTGGNQHASDGNEYSMNKYSLTFQDPTTELRYTNFCYIHSGFYGAKLWHAIGLGIFAAFIIGFHPLGIHGGAALLTDSRYILTDITMVSQIITLTCLFIPKLYHLREHLFLISLSTHWPAITTIVMIGKHPRPISYPYTLACYFFCSFLTQVRFARLFPFLTITPLLTLVIIVGSQTSYFETRAITEIAFWPSVFFPLMLLRIFEVRNRRNFEAMERSERTVADLGKRIEMVRSMVAHFFPPTPTIDLLIPPKSAGSPTKKSKRMAIEGNDDGDEELEVITTTNGNDLPPPIAAKPAWSPSLAAKSVTYKNTAMIVTDLAGFTSWTASYIHNPSIVISFLTNLFINIDRVMPLYKVEKIATVGDSFIGVIFDDEPGSDDANSRTTGRPKKLGLRASHAIQFGCDVLHVTTQAVADSAVANNETPTSNSVLLKMRVGVHVGDFVGGFVGTTPPKFDCFGQDFDIAKTMESSGTAGCVHITPTAAAEAMRWETRHERKTASEESTDELVRKFIDRSDDNTMTKAGLLCKRWEWSAPIRKTIADDPDATPQVDEDDDVDSLIDNDSNEADRFKELIEENAMAICHKLIDLRNDDPQQHVDADSSLRSPAGGNLSPHEMSVRSPFINGTPAPEEDEAASNDDGEEEEEEEEIDTSVYDFSYLWLEFKSRSVERHFTSSLLSQGELTTSFTILGLLQLTLVFAHSVNACLSSLENRLVLGACVALTGFWIGFVQRNGVQSLRSVFTILACAVTTFIVSNFQKADCGSRGEAISTGNIIASYYITAGIAGQFSLNIALKFRILFQFLISVLPVVMIAIRLEVLGDDGVIGWDANLLLYPAAFAALCFVSYFVDFSQRSSYASVRKLHRLQSSAKGKHADMATQAMDIMLPSFVSDALIRQSGNKKNAPPSREETSTDRSDNTEETGALSSSGRTPLKSPSKSNTDAHSDFGGATTASNGSRGHSFELSVLSSDGMVWEYGAVVVKFINFTLQEDTTPVTTTTNNATSDVADYEEINRIMIKLEKIVAKHQVQKVKSIGSTLMVVAGIDSGEGMADEPFVRTFYAALEARAMLDSRFKNNKDRCRYSIGINSGACFGAVIGVKGLCFDIFGDTVNTASRMCTTAANGTIQITDIARMSATVANEIPPNISMDRVPEPVVVKGKGSMTVFTVNNAAQAAVSSRSPTVASPTGTNGGSFPILDANGVSHSGEQSPFSASANP